MVERIGEIAAVSASVCFTATALCFEFAARRIGSLALNVLRLAVALAAFSLLGLVLRGELLPLSAPPSAWFWLSLSGLVGFLFGDLFLFQAYVDIGARTTQVVFSSAPLLTAVGGYFALGENVGAGGLAGMLLVVSGIALVILDARRTTGGTDGGPKLPAARRLRGYLFAFLGAVGQAGGYVLAKIGAPDSDPFASTQIRVVAGLAGFLAVAAVSGRLREIVSAASDRRALPVLSVGALFGPFLGVSLGLFAAQRADAGVAAALISLAPILILAPSVILKKERVRPREVLGAALAVAGSAVLFLY